MNSRLPLTGCRESRESLSAWNREARGRRTSAGQCCHLVLPTLLHTAGFPRSSVKTHLLKYPRAFDVAGRLAGAFGCLMSSWVVLVQGSHLETLLVMHECFLDSDGHLGGTACQKAPYPTYSQTSRRGSSNERKRCSSSWLL